ncbi:MAG: sulfotransferase [Bauldia sp.]
MNDAEWNDLPRWRVPFNWRAFGRKNRYLVRTTGKIGNRALRMSAVLGLYGANQAGWMLDQLVAPGWDKVAVNGPVFIIGHQRTGTTLLHRTLARDPNAVAMTLSEMLLPAVSTRRLIDAFWRFDATLGGRIKRFADDFQDRRLAGLEGIHQIRLDRIEEDEFVLFAVYRSGMAINSTPAVAADRELNRLRDFSAWSEEEKRLALGWYRAVLMKALYRAERTRGPNPHRFVVAKNPAFSQRIPDLLKVFPAAKFIHLVRNPTETIPSRLSLVQAVQALRNADHPGLSRGEIAEIVADSVRTYLLADRDLATLPADKAVTIRFEDLVGDIAGSVGRIYRQLRLPGEPPAVIEQRADGTSRGSHDYSLDEFGLAEADLRRELAPIYAEHGY